MAIDLASAGFAFRPEWYWRVTEDDGEFDPFAARSVLVSIGNLAAGRFTIADMFADPIARTLAFDLDGDRRMLAIATGSARTAIDHFVTDLNVMLAAYELAFALVIPRRYELRGVLLPSADLGDHVRDPLVLAPRDRRHWRRLARGTPNPDD